MEKWFVFYCKSRHEKKVADRLRKDGFSVFLPLQTVMQQWSDRKKKVEEPLFKGYIFVLCEEINLFRVCNINGIVAPLKMGGKFGFLRENEKTGIERLLTTGVYAEAVISDLQQGDLAEITEGPMRGLKGTCISESGQDYFLLEIDSLKLSLRVRIASAALKKL